MGKLLKISGFAITDPTVPVIKQFDEIESRGSLFLFDGSSSAGVFTGVPTLGAAIPNIVAPIASNVLGTPAASLHATVSRKDPNSSLFLVERTSKGGLHGIITQAGSQASEQSYRVGLPAAVNNRLRLNTSNAFYVSLWQRVTRKGIASGAPQSPFHFATNTSNYAFMFQNGLSLPLSADASYINRNNTPNIGDTDITEAPMNRFGAVAFRGLVGSGPAVSNSVEFGLGSFSAWNTFNLNKAASRIIYRAYVEDLTVSGRTFDEVYALDYALYQAAFAAGGKFAGDVYTDPSTLP